ncbi:MAG TPA: ribosome biogenesis GTPase Der, partial [Firmicutes bacterium]|nr:ribosome biogenesis GTPase Der [Bacillota bacterium]
MPLGTLALVGSPSSGKSTIFNRILGERKSIVEPTPGVTRDRIYGKATWLTKEFTIIDTGGIEVANAPFQKSIRAQVEIALEEADVIAFVVDGKKGLSGDDRFIAKMLYKSNKPKILLVNKIDNVQEVGNMAEFYRLGLGDPLICSGAHGIGIGDFLDKVIKMLPEKEEKQYGDAITFSIIGRPNVGKSS